MSESINIPVPPPPPPPTFLPPLNLNNTVQCTRNFMLPTPKEEVNKALQRAWPHSTANESTRILSFYKQVFPVLQEGPKCGLVALSMASQLLSMESSSVLEVDAIFNKAKEMDFTKEGEMFSAQNLRRLAETLIHCQAQVVTDVMLNKNSIISHVLHGWPLLVPYDADKNHEPCCRNGQTAHWAVITGVCLVVQSEHVPTREFPDAKINHVTNGLLLMPFLHKAEKICVYAHHGKSKHMVAWDIDELIESNNNLFEISNKYKDAQMVIPEGGVFTGLGNKLVLLAS